MPLSDRFYNRIIRVNNSPIYKELVETNRGLPNGMTQYTTPEMLYPTADQINTLTLVSHTWVISDKFYKLAHKHYGDSKLWWAIAWFNKTPTEAHLKPGDRIDIAFPLDALIAYYGL